MFNGLGRSLRAVAAIAASVLGMTALADRTRPDIPWRTDSHGRAQPEYI